MAQSKIPDKKVQLEEIAIRGRVQVKENRRPLPDLLVQVYWVDLKSLKGEIAMWHKYLELESVARLAGEEITNRSGSFSISLDRKYVVGDGLDIGLVVFAPDDDDSLGKPKPLYTSPMPGALTNRRTFLLVVPRERLEDAGQLPPKPPTATEILNRAEQKNREITDWLKADQKKRDDSIKKVVAKTNYAFSRFRPSSVPESIRKQDNYLEDRRQLKNTLATVRGKNLKQLEESGIIKKRQIVLSKDLVAQLGFNDEKKMVRISQEKLTELLSSEQYDGESSLRHSLAAMKQRKEREQKVVDILYKQFKLMYPDD